MTDEEFEKVFGKQVLDEMKERHANINRNARWHLTGIAILSLIAIAINYFFGGW